MPSAASLKMGLPAVRPTAASLSGTTAFPNFSALPVLSLSTCLFWQDTPGQVYGQTDVRVPDYITAQNERYLAWEQSPLRSVPMSAGDDHRVDACLFFLNPNHLKNAEVAHMVQLSELVPVVPMIAKVRADSPMIVFAAYALFVVPVCKRH